MYDLSGKIEICLNGVTAQLTNFLLNPNEAIIGTVTILQVNEVNQ